MPTGSAAWGPNIAGALFHMAEQQPDAIAVYIPEGPRSQGLARYRKVTYAELAKDALHVAAGLSAVGIGRGERVALMVRPGADFLALVFGLFHAGVVPVMIDPGIGLSSLKTCLAEARPGAFIGIPTAHAARIALGWGKDTITRNVTVGTRLGWGGHTLDDVRRRGAAAEGWKVPAVTADELAAIVFTSGSTGIPKGVEYTHGNFVAQVELLGASLGIKPGEVEVPTFPLFALFDPALGMTTVLPKMDFTKPAKVDPQEILEPVRLFNVSTMFGSPALLNRVGRALGDTGATMPSLRRVISAGAPVPADVMERLLPMLSPDVRILTPYGATESLPVALIDHREILEETRHKTAVGAGVCVGRPVAGVRVEVIGITDGPIDAWDDSLRVTGTTIGEFVVAGPNVTRAYFGRDAATKLAKIRGPGGEVMHRMGDVGWRDESGRLWFCGRKSHRVVTKTGTLFTEPCEVPFTTLSPVFRAALVGVPKGDDMMPVMCIELHAGASKNDALLADLKRIAAAHDHTKDIHTFLFHPAFPVDIRHNSKIGREKLAVWAREQLS